MGVNTFLKGICPKVNVIARLENELAEYFTAVELGTKPTWLYDAELAWYSPSATHRIEAQLLGVPNFVWSSNFLLYSRDTTIRIYIHAET